MARAPAKLNFLPLTFDTVERLSGLATAPQKAHLVRPAARLIAQAALSAENTTFGVFLDDVAVGLISLDDPRVMNEPADPLTRDCLDIWQLLVDGKHERQGIGRAMVEFAKSYAQLVGLSGLALNTMDNAKHAPLAFYEKLGFAPTGRRHQVGRDDMIELVWRAPT